MHTKEQLKEYYGTSFENYEEIWLPERTLMQESFYEFYDAFLAELLTKLRRYFQIFLWKFGWTQIR